jgi:protoheme IX farnesyltransferase
MAAILYSWQFPHFHSLSWNLRAEYSRAGYRMISVLNPRICTSSSLSHTIALLVMCSCLAPIFELTTWNFAIDSLPFSLYFIYLAVQFKRNADAQSSRKLFRYSLIYLPMIILLMLITKSPVKNIDDELNKKLENDLLELRERIKYLKKNV